MKLTKEEKNLIKALLYNELEYCESKERLAYGEITKEDKKIAKTIKSILNKIKEEEK